jgi:hypothetical protein
MNSVLIIHDKKPENIKNRLVTTSKLWVARSNRAESQGVSPVKIWTSFFQKKMHIITKCRRDHKWLVRRHPGNELIAPKSQRSKYCSDTTFFKICIIIYEVKP